MGKIREHPDALVLYISRYSLKYLSMIVANEVKVLVFSFEVIFIYNGMYSS